MGAASWSAAAAGDPFLESATLKALAIVCRPTLKEVVCSSMLSSTGSTSVATAEVMDSSSPKHSATIFLTLFNTQTNTNTNTIKRRGGGGRKGRGWTHLSSADCDTAAAESAWPGPSAHCRNSTGNTADTYGLKSKSRCECTEMTSRSAASSRYWCVPGPGPASEVRMAARNSD